MSKQGPGPMVGIFKSFLWLCAVPLMAWAIGGWRVDQTTIEAAAKAERASQVLMSQWWDALPMDMAGYTLLAGDAAASSAQRHYEVGQSRFWNVQRFHFPLIVWRLYGVCGAIFAALPLFIAAVFLGRARACQRAVDGKRPSGDLFGWSVRGVWWTLAVILCLCAWPWSIPMGVVTAIGLALIAVLVWFAASVAAEI